MNGDFRTRLVRTAHERVKVPLGSEEPHTQYKRTIAGDVGITDIGGIPSVGHPNSLLKNSIPNPIAKRRHLPFKAHRFQSSKALRMDHIRMEFIGAQLVGPAGKGNDLVHLSQHHRSAKRRVQSSYQ